MPPPRRTFHAFTLLELLVCLCITAILLSLVVSVAGNFRSKGRTTQCLSQMRQTGIAFLAYAGENDGNLPVQKNSSTSIWDPAGWVAQLAPYAGGYNGQLCPESKAPKRSASYLYNSFVSTHSLPGRASVKLASSTQPASNILLLDQQVSLTTEGWTAAVVSTVEAPSTWWRYPHPHKNVRNGAQCVLFVDGHVELAPRNTLKWQQLQWPQ